MLYEIVLADIDNKRLAATLDDLNEEYFVFEAKSTHIATQLMIFHNRVLQRILEFAQPISLRPGQTLYFSADDLKRELR